ncbi:MAG: fluoride efflux transporter CrcB [Desertimonas sp.]
MTVILVAVAGAIGAVSRYGVGRAIGPRAFPWATLGINLVGSFALGWVVQRALQRDWSTETTTAITVGFLGAFTTFSTFSNETWTLLRTDRAGDALAYVAMSMIAGVAAAAVGYRLG